MTLSITDGSPEGEDRQPLAIDTDSDLRPDLAALGIDEVERGVCQDTYDNRKILRAAKLRYQAVYDTAGHATGLILVLARESDVERRILSLAEKKPLLVDPDNRNSDYLTGLDLLVDSTACGMVPPWVLGATRAWHQEQLDGGVPHTSGRMPKYAPHRCNVIKDDTIRCMLWASGLPKDGGMCRVHLRSAHKPSNDLERARRKVIQAAPYAVDVLEELMETAESEPVRLKASTEILDRAGIRAGIDVNLEAEIIDSRPASQIIAERLGRLAEGANALAAIQRLAEQENIIDAEVVDDSDSNNSVERAEVMSPSAEESSDSDNGETLTPRAPAPAPDSASDDSGDFIQTSGFTDDDI